MNIRLENITKKFKDTTAVNCLNISIQSGELVCLLGPSGCGKSTTLSMVAGLESPTEGEIYFEDRPMSQVEPEKRDIGMVFQNYALYPHMTVLDNIMFPLKMRRVPKKERIALAKEAGAMMQITELLSRHPGELSGGQQQRVAIARALVKKPQILLLDEPFSNLDARLRIELREDIRALQKKLGITTIFVTHDQEEAMSISDRILLMRKGKLQQYSTPEEMYRHPVNRFTAGFLGNPPINFLPCEVNDNRPLLKGIPDWSLSEEKVQCSCPGICGEAVLGIRPEDISISEEAGIDMRITAMQPLGKEIYLKLEAGPHKLTACLSWDHVYHVGDILPVSFKKVHIFPAEEEERGTGHEV